MFVGCRSSRTGCLIHNLTGSRNYSLGMIIQAIRYASRPGTPPGIDAIRNASRNQIGLMPKNSPKPPQTPAKIRLLFERRSTFRGWSLIVYLQKHSNIHFRVYIRYLLARVASSSQFYSDQGAISSRENCADHARVCGNKPVKGFHLINGLPFMFASHRPSP